MKGDAQLPTTMDAMTTAEINELQRFRRPVDEKDKVPTLMARVRRLPKAKREALFLRFRERCDLTFGDNLIFALQNIQDEERRGAGWE